eukprot:4304841-Amphidinium_carterae.1
MATSFATSWVQLYEEMGSRKEMKMGKPHYTHPQGVEVGPSSTQESISNYPFATAMVCPQRTRGSSSIAFGPFATAMSNEQLRNAMSIAELLFMVSGGEGCTLQLLN